MRHVLLVPAALAALTFSPLAAQDTAWTAVERALGRKGQLQDGGVYRVPLPRSDLSVTVRGIAIKPALSLGGWVGYARLIRAQVLAAREREYVEAARALGAADGRILFRHILPNIVQPVIVQAAIGMAGAILAEATMSFLGLGVPPPTASWGTMLNDGRSHLFDAPHLVLFPALAVMLAVLSFNFIGDALRDMLDPRSRIEAGL